MKTAYIIIGYTGIVTHIQWNYLVCNDLESAKYKLNQLEEIFKNKFYMISKNVTHGIHYRLPGSSEVIPPELSAEVRKLDKDFHYGNYILYKIHAINFYDPGTYNNEVF